jgi:chromosome segregation ATPase
MEVNWCIEHPKEAIERFGEIRKELSEWEKELNSRRKDEKEFGESYLEIRETINEFSDFYTKAVATNRDLGSLIKGHGRGDVQDDNYSQRKSQLTLKLTESFQSLIDIHDKIKEIKSSLSPPSKSEKGMMEDFINNEERREHDWKSQIESFKEELKKREILLALYKRKHDLLKDKLDAAMMKVDSSCLEILTRYI